ncbi:hypothetical protein [Nocardioides sp. InS609-2]|uniref:hypothetical protein n=1 Tax=Nocardioides sp. InS609-2 TaxID=2760705 RepID=UPI0020C133BF|nr:hypothetical protein [Nocardioides sp. InS609-2]
MEQKLDKQYVENHLGAHDYESFGRSVVAEILEEALERTSDQGEFEEMDIDIKTTLRATSSGCIWLIMIVNGRRVRFHQPPIMSF